MLERFMAACNAGDVDTLMAGMAGTCAFHACAGSEAEGQCHTDRDAARAVYEAVFAAFPTAEWRHGEHRVVGNLGVST